MSNVLICGNRCPNENSTREMMSILQGGEASGKAPLGYGDGADLEVGKQRIVDHFNLQRRGFGPVPQTSHPG